MTSAQMYEMKFYKAYSEANCKTDPVVGIQLEDEHLDEHVDHDPCRTPPQRRLFQSPKKAASRPIAKN